MIKKLCIFGIFAVMGCVGAVALSVSAGAEIKGAPVPFSADWASYEDGQRLEGGKYYASSEGFRLEGTAGGESFVMIYNFKRMVAWNLIESERMYIETPIDSDELEMDDLGQFGTPCPPEARATRSGSDTLDGRRTEKWTCVLPDEPTMTVWYDTRLQAPIRTEDEDGRFELTNIKEGPQPSDLFVPPPGYKKIEIPGFGMPAGSSYGGQQTGSMEEMMRGMMQEMEAEEGKGGRPRGSDDATEGMMESLRGLFGR